MAGKKIKTITGILGKTFNAVGKDIQEGLDQNRQRRRDRADAMHEASLRAIRKGQLTQREKDKKALFGF